VSRCARRVLDARAGEEVESRAGDGKPGGGRYIAWTEVRAVQSWRARLNQAPRCLGLMLFSRALEGGRVRAA